LGEVANDLKAGVIAMQLAQSHSRALTFVRRLVLF
jgi:hypothetical protein